jgi:hypothetical protein
MRDPPINPDLPLRLKIRAKRYLVVLPLASAAVLLAATGFDASYRE